MSALPLLAGGATSAVHALFGAPTLRSRTHTLTDSPSASLAGFWDATRLRRVVSQVFGGDQLIVVSNRQPYSHERSDGQVRLAQPAGGLIAAMEPVVRACAGTWIAHGSGNADRELVDENDEWQTPSDRGVYRLRRVWLSDEEQRCFGDGFSNSGLWPLCHMVHVRPSFTERDWAAYRTVNRRFADAIVDAARQPDPVVLVNDYHLALVPALVRSRLPRATILSFWHVPWSHPEQMGICPWLPELVNGLLGSDIVGFQTPEHLQNFLASAGRVGKPVLGGADGDIVCRGHRSRARAYPISVAWPTGPDAIERPDAVLPAGGEPARNGLPPDGRLIVGIDRFDYTKGLLERLHAVEHLLLTQPSWRGRLRYVQVAAPTRTAVGDYIAFRARVFSEVARINARFAGCWPAPISLLDVQHDHIAVNALYRAADLCLVTSLHDGMNLVCKEFVAARDDEQGVLVLSRFAGAAHELSEALIVNPYHSAQVAAAIHQGLTMPAEEQRRRMRALRATVKDRNVYRWAAGMLLDAAALRAPSPARQIDTLAPCPLGAMG